MLKIYKGVLVITLLVICQFALAQNNRNPNRRANQNCWIDTNEKSFGTEGVRAILPQKFRAIQIDVPALKSQLLQAPTEMVARAANSSTIITLPMPDGSTQRFRIIEAPVMHPALAAKYPMIKTYAGQGIDDATAVVRLDITQFGFHAMILSSQGDVFIDPYRHLQTSNDYISYYRSDYSNASKHFTCGVTDEMSESYFNRAPAPVSVTRSIGNQFREYRLALACTGEYAAYFGGTTAGALAGMVTSINRVTGVYEHELDIRLTLIANTDTLIYLNAATDPYDNNNGGTMLGQNQATCNQLIGSSNYDIGHVFSTGGGGIAGLGVVCGGSKAQGVTGSTAPVGDAFDIDYVAHEMGHQFGGNHTFNSQTGSCGGGNRAGSAAYEPGSGITVMAYAGICGSDDLASHSIANFHTKSFDEIINYTTQSTGNSCPVMTIIGNNPPVINPMPHTWYIPYFTPFKLTGSATDADIADTLTYSWEEFDLGAGGAWNAPTGGAPIFKPYAPSLSGVRLFPILANILADTPPGFLASKGELKPAYARILHFRLTVRDNALNGGGVTYNDTLVAVNVINTVDTFRITYPNVAGISWPANSSQTITWNVAATTASPINTPNVNIYLSTDGGQTFPITLAANVPNTGNYTLVVPNNLTTTARVWVQGAGNIFFDINNKNFTITSPVGIDNITLNDLFNVYPNPSNGNYEIVYSTKTNGIFKMNITDALGRVIKSVNAETINSFFRYSLDLTKESNGIYFIEIILPEGKAVKKITKL